jgi:hypothetical protein
MTPEERNVLLPLIDKLRQTDIPQKDAEAEQMINQLMVAKPDSAYILAQTVLMQDYALHQAQDRIQQLQAQIQGSSQASGSSGGFLGGLFGNRQAPATAQPQYQQPQPQPAPWGPRPVQPSPYAQPMMAAVQPGMAQPSFLRSAAQTAAGIAGGALLFDSISSLFGGHGGYGGGFGGGGFMGGGGFGQPQDIVETNETVNNNYYDQPAPDDGGQGDGFVDDGSNGGDIGGGNDDSFGI